RRRRRCEVIATFHAPRVLGENAHRRLDLCGQLLGVRRGKRQQSHLQRRVIVAMMVVTVVMIMFMVFTMSVVVVMPVVVVTVIVWSACPQNVMTCGQLVGARPLKGVLRFEESAVDSQRAIQIEGAQAQHYVDGNRGILCTEHLRGAVDPADR